MNGTNGQAPNAGVTIDVEVDTDHDRFIANLVNSGRYPSSDAVVQAALRLLEDRQDRDNEPSGP